MIAITFKCGHSVQLDDVADAPVCTTCGERQIGNVTAPTPRFTGACSGPLVVKG